VSVSTDGSLRVTSLSGPAYGTSFATDTDAVGVAASRKNNSLLFAAALDGIVRVASGGAAAAQLAKTKTPFAPSSIALSPDDSFLAVGAADASIHIYSVSAAGDIKVCKKGRGVFFFFCSSFIILHSKGSHGVEGTSRKGELRHLFS
jgi:WD40 repeat protein